jgi:hypothetical protein
MIFGLLFNDQIPYQFKRRAGLVPRCENFKVRTARGKPRPTRHSSESWNPAQLSKKIPAQPDNRFCPLRGVFVFTGFQLALE